MGVKGEKRWTGGGDVVKTVFTPVPNKDWEVKLIASAVKLDKQKPESGGIPYLSGLRFQCFNSAEKEGGKDRIIFHALFLGLKPDKNGNVSPSYANGLRGLMKALGDVRDFDIKTKELEDGDSIDYLDPKQIQEYLKEHDGDTLQLHSKIKNSEQYGAQAQVDYFIEAEGSEEAPEEEAEEAPEEEAEEPEETEEEPEEAPAPKKATKGKKK